MLARSAILPWVLVGCTSSERLDLPAPPSDARSALLFVGRGEQDQALIAEVSDGAVKLAPISIERDETLALLYFSLHLSSLQLSPGVIERGPTPLPTPIEIHQGSLGAWAKESSLEALGADVVGFGLPTVDADACARAGGCVGVSPTPELCQLPCPCPTREDELGERWTFASECSVPSRPRAALCYRPPRPFDALNALGRNAGGAQGHPGQMIREGDRDVLYFETDRYAVPIDGNGNVYTRIAKVVVTGIDTVDALSVEDVGLIESPTNAGPLGWLSPPRVRPDGLELVLDGSYPDGNWADDEVSLASRPSVSAPFGRLVPITAIAKADNAPDVGEYGDEVKRPALLPDDRTLLYLETVNNRVQYARRPSAAAGTTDFAPVEGEGFVGQDMQGMTLSCDRTHLLFVEVRRGDDAPRAIYAARIASLSPVRFDRPTPLRSADTGLDLIIQTDGDTFLSERPDCRAIYVGTRGITHILEPAPCP